LSLTFLIVGFADNMTDALSIHIYQESERLEQHAAFRATFGNFATRLIVSLSFVLIVTVMSSVHAMMAAMTWSIVLLMGLTWLTAKNLKPTCGLKC
jgi:hypothetical protein